MDLDAFIQAHRPEWEELDRLVQRGPVSGVEVDRLVSLYLTTATQLSEVRASAHDPDLQRYLNDLVTRAHGRVYAATPEDRPSVKDLFITRYREAVRETRPFILLACAILVVVTAATWMWVALSPEAQAGVVSPGVAAAIEEAGGGRDPSFWPPTGIATFITLNNIQVALLCFGLGVTFGVGTIYVLVVNAAMLGELAGAFTAAGKGGPFWSLILPHGMLELLAIAIAAGAGLRMGWALVAPGDAGRAEPLQRAALGAVVVVVGVVPAFVIAGVIEGFITGTGVPDVLEMAIGTVAFVGYAILVFWPSRRPAPAPGGGAPRVLIPGFGDHADTSSVEAEATVGQRP